MSSMLAAPGLSGYWSQFLTLRDLGRICGASRQMHVIAAAGIRARMGLGPSSPCAIVGRVLRAIDQLCEGNARDSLSSLRSALALSDGNGEALRRVFEGVLASLSASQVTTLADNTGDSFVTEIVRSLGAAACQLPSGRDADSQELVGCANAFKVLRDASHRSIGRALPKERGDRRLAGCARDALTRAFGIHFNEDGSIGQAPARPAAHNATHKRN